MIDVVVAILVASGVALVFTMVGLAWWDEIAELIEEARR